MLASAILLAHLATMVLVQSAGTSHTLMAEEEEACQTPALEEPRWTVDFATNTAEVDTMVLDLFAGTVLLSHMAEVLESPQLSVKVVCRTMLDFATSTANQDSMESVQFVGNIAAQQLLLTVVPAVVHLHLFASRTSST